MKLADWRREKDKTQGWVAEKLGCSVAAVSQLESGKQLPSFEMLTKISALSDDMVRDRDFRPEPVEPPPLADLHREDERPLSSRRKSVA